MAKKKSLHNPDESNPGNQRKSANLDFGVCSKISYFRCFTICRSNRTEDNKRRCCLIMVTEQLFTGVLSTLYYHITRTLPKMNRAWVCLSIIMTCATVCNHENTTWKTWTFLPPSLLLYGSSIPTYTGLKSWATPR
jgi:hypothetical protein